MKKVLKIIGCVLLIGALWFANGFFGNPVSKWLAARAANNYLKENFADTAYEAEQTVYSFKDGKYHTRIVLPGSADSTFTLSFTMGGKLFYSTYAVAVLSRWNTAERLIMEYAELTEAVFAAADLPYASEIRFGELRFAWDAQARESAYAIPAEELELDGIYDIKVLGAQAGELTVYFCDETVTAERLSEMLLAIRAAFDAADVPFRTIDCVLESPLPETGKWNMERMEVMNFPYEEIYAEGLATRVEASNAAADAYYAEMDEVKKTAEAYPQ